MKLLKIDVEGAELAVLRGAYETLKKTKYVMIEVWDQNKDEVFNLMRSLGFRLIWKRRYFPPTTNVLFSATD